MKVGILQFAPVLGDRDGNIAKADQILADSDVSGIQLLVLPELAFSGYAFTSLNHITPFLEPSQAGPSTQWAVQTASSLHCFICVGYPETSTVNGQPKNYNSLVTVNPQGQVVAHYRKSFLYYTDETWAAEGAGFLQQNIQGLPNQSGDSRGQDVGRNGGQNRTVAMGICMDINPYKFQTPWDTYEFATHVMSCRASLVVLSMAWLTQMLPEEILAKKDTPDYETLNYWLARFQPLLKSSSDQETVIVFGNRCGLEPGAVAGVTRGVDGDGEAMVGYAGSSCVMGFKNGSAQIWDILGRGQEAVLVVDTDSPAKFALVKKEAEVE